MFAIQRIAIRLKKGPATVQELAKECFASPHTIQMALYRGEGICFYIKDWMNNPNPNGGGPVSLWAYGSSMSAEYPVKKSINNIQDWRTADSATKILEHLSCRGPATLKDLAASCGIAQRTADIVLRQMRKFDENGWRPVHISDYISSYGYGGSHTRVYALGNKPDKKPPPKLGKAALWKRYVKGLKDRYGEEDAKRILTSLAKGGPSVIVRNGRVIYRRQEAA